MKVKKIVKFIFFIILIFVISLVQFSFIPALAPLPAAANLFLVVAIFILFFFDLRLATAAVILGGFFWDILSFNFFGFYLFSLVLTLLAAYWIMRAWLTNRSFYAWLILMTIMTIIYSLIASLLLYFFIYSGQTFFLMNGNFWQQLFYQLVDNFILALFLGLLAAAVTKRLRPFFLEKS